MKKAYLFSMMAAALILSACGSASTPSAIPTIVLDDNSNNNPTPVSRGGGIIASGIILPVREADMAFTVGGTVKTVNVAVGDQVKTGQALMELDNTIAQLEVEQAARALRELTSQASIAAASRAVASTQQDLEDAQNKVDGLFFPRASDTLIDNVKGEIDLAKKQVAIASDGYRQFSRRSDGDPLKAEALVAMTNAQLNLNALVAKYRWYTGKPTEIDAAIARADLDAAKAAYQEAQWYLAALKGEQIPAEATGTQLAQLQQARDLLKAAQDRLDHTRLIAPISGRIGLVNAIAGEYASPGQVLIVVSDIDHLQVETTDLSERDITKVKLGDAARITVDALNQEFNGRVISISPIANTLGGDVVYKVTITIEKQSKELLGGMSAEVSIGN